MDEFRVIDAEELYFQQAELSGWTCELFGFGQQIVLTPLNEKVPNWFWRWMQYICFGNKWIKK